MNCKCSGWDFSKRIFRFLRPQCAVFKGTESRNIESNIKNLILLTDMVSLKMDIGKLLVMGKRTMKIPNDYMMYSDRKYIIMRRNIG